MLDMKLIRHEPDLVRQVIARRRMDVERVGLDRLIESDGRWRELQRELDTARSERNSLSAQIKRLVGDERKQAVERVKGLKLRMAELEQAVDAQKEARDGLLRGIPNLLAEDVPDGATDEENVELARVGDPPLLDAPRDHVELGRLTDTIDFERAAKVCGSSFYYLKREAVLLEQALLSYAAQQLLPKDFVLLATPDLARDQILEGIGFSPRGPETQVYSVQDSDLSLIGTAEITIGGYHGDEVLDGARLPLRYLGFSHCFRTEAGAHGRESRGLYRVHQFSKAEMFVLCRPEQSPDIHDSLRRVEEQLLQGLGLAYRVVNVCAGDLGAPAYKKYDIEAWMPGRGAYGEVTSCSNCTDYQARRLNVRFKDEGSSPAFVHMLNGTALAVSRTLLAIYENYQRPDGSIEVPEALRPAMGGCSLIPRRQAA